MEDQFIHIQKSYDILADQYAERYFHELEHKPLDRKLLDEFAGLVDGLGPVCDLGCGPGQIARYLSEKGVASLGIDLSEEMINIARRLNPSIEFREGNMLSLDLDEDSLGGVAAFYSIIHIPREKVVAVLKGIKRVLKPGGVLLMSFHLGNEKMHLDELWGEQVDMDFFFFTVDEVENYLSVAGFQHLKTVTREPYLDVEYQSRRAYIMARK
jgi:SAM-dependent methyltransferase